MDNLVPPSGGNGSSPKRQRIQPAAGQDCSVPSTGSQDERTENGTEGHAINDAAHEVEPEGGPQLSDSFDNMTETVKAGMLMIHSRTQAADAKVIMRCLPPYLANIGCVSPPHLI